MHLSLKFVIILRSYIVWIIYIHIKESFYLFTRNFLSLDICQYYQRYGLDRSIEEQGLWRLHFISYLFCVLCARLRTHYVHVTIFHLILPAVLLIECDTFVHRMKLKLTLSLYVLNSKVVIQIQARLAS